MTPDEILLLIRLPTFNVNDAHAGRLPINRELRALVPAAHKLVVVHTFNADELPAWQRTHKRPPRYVTEARLMRGDTQVAIGFSLCSHKDQPRRWFGYAQAAARCLKQHYEIVGVRLPGLTIGKAAQ